MIKTKRRKKKATNRKHAKNNVIISLKKRRKKDIRKIVLPWLTDVKRNQKKVKNRYVKNTKLVLLKGE